MRNASGEGFVLTSVGAATAAQFGGCRGSGPGRLMCAEEAASGSDARDRSMGWGSGSTFAWVAILGHLGGSFVGSVDAPQKGWLDGMSGRRPGMWCGVRGLRAVVLRSVGCEQPGRAALELESEQWHVGWEARKVVLVGCAGRGEESWGGGPEFSAASSTLTSCRVGDEVALYVGHRLQCWRPSFYDNDDEGSDVGDPTVVEVVGSSPPYLRDCLGRFVAMKSKLRWRVPVAYDDGQQVVCLVIFSGASRA